MHKRYASTGRQKDIIHLIKDFTFKQAPAEKLEGLLPTLPNLYGLDVRFKYTERKIKEDKERRRATNKSNGQGIMQDGVSQNRHAILRDENKISPTTYKT